MNCYPKAIRSQGGVARYTDLLRRFGPQTFRDACAIAKREPVSVEDACKRIRANEEQKKLLPVSCL